MTAIIDYGAGNLRSVRQALEAAGARCVVVSTPADWLGAERLVLPGVGAFAAAVAGLQGSGCWEGLRRWLDEDLPLLGICLGMQLFFEGSEESPAASGLGVLPGSCRRFRCARVPHVGWNRVFPAAPTPLWRGIEAGSHFYFVHGYHAPVREDPAVAAWSDHGGLFPAVVQRGRSLGVQFHPEKSGEAGLRLLANWVQKW